MKWLVLTLIFAWGCTNTVHETPRQTLRSEGETVALVGARSVARADVELVWREHPDWTREEVLDWVVRREQIVANALDSGVVDTPASQTSRKRALIRTVLAQEVDSIRGVVTDDDRFAARRELSVPAGHRVTHVAIAFPQDASPALIEKARIEAEALVARAGDTPNEVEFGNAMTPLAEPLHIRLDAHLRFAASNQTGIAPEGWKIVDPAFLVGVEKLVASGSTYSAIPLRSQSAWHVVIYEEALPGSVALDADVERHAQEIADRRARTEAFRNVVTEQLQMADLELFPDSLGLKTEKK